MCYFRIAYGSNQTGRLLMSKIVYKGNIAGSFRGFNTEQLFKLANGTYWIQAEYKYWYHYEYGPKVVITEENDKYILTVANNSVPVRRVSDIIESRIAGNFEGWQGNSTYTLANGQVWQQTTYKYEYKYAYNPEVIIYSSLGGYKMEVEGTVAEVRRIK
jgi:hypothetical protein